ncbi:peptidase domain-containing ABC transporter [Oceanitalea stevensii]|uniref:Peptidase domain-containing ABC transporter n=1 Tax=Oceanitalea stevensii TaxID=2763072 RepID=A0ABR8Z5I8_9MICO|nr:peptidase domain-containing ABC transporter [Oceanitalea stevensii]MBD8063589.1 peptidase domain-containing ABC transporter [Oceanitalea stevensii]
MSARAHQRVPVVQQYAQSECGLCCAAMILGAWGRRAAIRNLRSEVDPGRDGLSLRDIAEILRGRGMQVSFFRANVAGLSRIDTPVIAHWNGNHVVVVEKVTPRGAWIVDPASGRRRVGLEELERSFSELVLVCTPTADFERGTEDSRSVWREVVGAVRSGTGRPMLAAGALSLVLYSVVLAVPMATERLVNGAGTELLTAPASAQVLLLSVPVLGYVLIAAVRSKILAALVATVGSSLMSATFGRLITLPYRYFATRSQGELMMRLSSVSQIRDMLSNQVTAALLDAGTLVVALLYVTQSSAGLGAVTIALIGVVVLVNTLTWGRLRRRTDQEITALAEASGVQMEAVSSVAAIKTSGMGERFYANWRLRYAAAVHHGRRRMELQGYVSALVSGVQIFGPFVILVVGLNMVLSGHADLGAVIASQALAATALGTTTSLTSTVGQFVQAQAQVQRMGDILLQPSEETVFGTAAHEPRGAIAAEELTFSYPGAGRPALQGVTFRAEPGERVAVVGSTGSGKSTLAKVLVGLYPASSGTIRLDGRPIGTVREADFRDGVAYVPQDVVLSNRSIAANIDFSAGEPDMERVREAAAQAHVLDAVLAMPLGFDTEIREMGANVSGGQRQRIALARALARRPRVLVMDEATSALDNATENQVARSLRELRCTQIIIAHRLSTIRDADRVVVMDDGRVVQTGTPRELAAVDGPYRRLVESGADEDRTSGLDEWLSPSRPDAS